nr:polysaccharide deacetylase family protein [bacterium]
GDLLDNYPGLAGVDIGEPVVAWQSAHCSCASCTRQKTEIGWNDVSALGLNKTLLAGFELIHSYQKIACVTSVVSPKADGSLYTPAEQRGYTGFDLNALLDSENRPNWISLELMWQQWADLYQNPALFSPDWIRQAAAIVKNQVAERSRVLAHLELTPFGRQGVDAAQLKQSMLAAKEAGVVDLDLYDSHQIDRDEAWPTVREGFHRQIVRRALIVSDPLGENDARQVAGLLSHFQTETEIFLLPDDGGYVPGKMQNQDLLFYIGVDPKFSIPKSFLQEAAAFDGILAWIHFGIDQYLKQSGAADYGIQYAGSAFDSSWNRVRYKSAMLFKQDPDFNRLLIQDSSRCKVHAWLENGSERIPYAVHSGNLWYFADLTTAFVLEGGSYIVFADLLHDIVGQNHRSNPLAMVRIEDLSPLSDVVSLRRIADYLSSQNVPFSISLVPFYLDPANNTAASLSDQPEFVKTIQYMVRKGGVIVMHGNTHQYRGETTSDYEFWDMMNDGPLFSDSREYVRERLESGMEELAKNGLFPVTWETPHYGASQLDYAVINGYFTSAYERRQTIDLHGSDQLVPWLIYRHAAGGKIIPENLGYIPLSRQEAGPLLQAARNHLALRDGIASFFFHPFVDLNVLKDIIPRMKQMGYRFTDPRHTSQQVRGKTFRVLTGSGDIELPLTSPYVREFFLDPHGAIHDETLSTRPANDTLRKTISTPEGWIYVAQSVAAKPKGRVADFLADVTNRMPRSVDYFAASRPLAVPNGQPIRMALLYDREAKGRAARDQDNWQRALVSVGLDAQQLQVDEFFTVPEGANLILVPHAAALKLTQQQVLLLVRTVQNGAHLILERPSNLSAAIGITLKDSLCAVASIVDEYYPTVAIQWSSTDTLTKFETEFDYITYASEPVSGNPVVIGGDYGNGRYLYWATFFDPDSEGGFGRFPFVMEMLRYHFGLQPLVRRDAVEIYFDPGSREDISIEDLIKLWRKNGVRIINVAGWHSYRDYTYEYGRLIELAHLNAMSVYLWLELPHVSDKFWLDHPPWREQNALGADIDTSAAHWRRPMALNLPECREAVMAELRAILMAHDWDGINLAELYYDSAAGPADPKWFTPMNSGFRQEFSRRHGFDPLSLFTPHSSRHWRQDPKALEALYELRREQIIDQHRRFLEFFKNLEKEKNSVWKIIVTTLDDA